MRDLYNYKGMLKTKDAREVFVDNVSNGGWNNSSYKNAVFRTSALRKCRSSDEELSLYKDIIDAMANPENKK